MFDHDPKAGPTGEPGDPRLEPNENYAIRIAVRPNHRARMVVLDFGTAKVGWVAIPVERVEALVVALAEAVAELKGGG